MYENAAYLLFGIALGISLMAYVWYVDRDKREAEINHIDQLYADAIRQGSRCLDGWRDAAALAFSEAERADMYMTAFRGEMTRQLNREFEEKQ